jgi:hypothetical protein
MKKFLYLFVLIILAFSAKSQYVPMTSAGYQFKGVLADTLMFATGCGAPVTTPGLNYHRSAIYYDTCGSKGFYVYDPPTFTWNLIGSGDASFPIYVDTLFSIDDSTVRWCKGSVCHDILIKGGDFTSDCSGSGEQITNTLDIYHENVEWTTSVSGAEFNAASTNFPCNGSKSIEATTVGNNDFINFTAPSVPDYTAYNYLVFKISSKATWTAGQRIRFRWLNGSSAVGVGVNFTDGGYGFKSNITDSCQLIYIPLGAFGTITGANKLHVEGSITSSGTIGFYIDDIVLQQSNVSAVFGSAITWDQTMRHSPDISQDYFSHFNSTTWTMDSILQLRIHVQDWVDIIGDKDAGREYMLKMHVNDGGNSQLDFANSTVSNGAYSPLIIGYRADLGDFGSLSQRGIVDSANDAIGSVEPAIQLVAGKTPTSNTDDPNAVGIQDLVNKPLAAIGNATFQATIWLATGQIQLPKYVSGAFAGTPAYGLALDASGNVIVTDTAGGGGSADRFGLEDVTAGEDRTFHTIDHNLVLEADDVSTFLFGHNQIYIQNNIDATAQQKAVLDFYGDGTVSLGGYDNTAGTNADVLYNMGDLIMQASDNPNSHQHVLYMSPTLIEMYTFGAGQKLSLQLDNLPDFADNAAAITGGLAVGAVYRNGDALQIVH